MQQKRKNFHRHFETPGLNLYWIIIAYIIVGWFYPVVGLIALICMIGPVMTSIWKGRWWCGHVCPRGKASNSHSPFLGAREVWLCGVVLVACSGQLS